MRRFILIFLMVLLPVQWSWAAAASVCAHEKDTSHFGHHEHEHAAAPQVSAEPDEGDIKAPSVHLDCQVCHGIGAACVTASTEVGAAWSPTGPPASYGRHVPEPPVESLLRPPLTLVA
jgi:hypothetical protein